MRDWVVIYDADCELCKWLLALFLRWDRAERLRPLALQRPEADELLADLSPEQRAASWHLVSPDGRGYSAGAALAPMLRLLPAGRTPAAAASRMPGATERGYRWVADHRVQLSRFVPAPLKRRGAERVRARERSLSSLP